MSKMRVYELAKQIEKDSADILAVLKEKGVEVKNHMSSIDEAAVELVKNAFNNKAKKAEEPKKIQEPKKEEARNQEKKQQSNNQQPNNQQHNQQKHNQLHCQILLYTSRLMSQ